MELYRVTYITAGMQRRTKTLDADTLAWLREAWHTGMQVRSVRVATAKEAAKGAFKGALNV